MNKIIIALVVFAVAYSIIISFEESPSSSYCDEQCQAELDYGRGVQEIQMRSYR